MAAAARAERPVLFSGEMVQAIRAGRKTQTRRVMKPQPKGVVGKTWPDPDSWAWPSSLARTMVDINEARSLSPYGCRGDRLWVRETFALLWPGEGPPENAQENRVEYRADGDPSRFPGEWPPESAKDAERPRWRPGIFMPRWASRIVLEVTRVRIEQVQEISEQDAAAEGVRPLQMDRGSYLPSFEGLWDTINAPRGYGWSTNPWVFVIEYRVIQSLAPPASHSV